MIPNKTQDWTPGFGFLFPKRYERIFFPHVVWYKQIFPAFKQGSLRA